MDKNTEETLSENAKSQFEDENDKKQEIIVRNSPIPNTKNKKPRTKIRRNKKSDGCGITSVAGVRG